MTPAPPSCKHSAEFHILIWLGFEYGTFCMQGELSTPHQRVIIGSLWSTWRLRAPRKQLSLHLTLDCLSQQTPFPSPLPVFSSKFPPHRNSLWCTRRRKGKWRCSLCSRKDAFLSVPALMLSVVWTRTVTCQDSASWILELTCLSSASQSEKSCSVKVPPVTGAVSGYIYKDLCFSNYSSKASRELSSIHDHCGTFSLFN